MHFQKKMFAAILMVVLTAGLCAQIGWVTTPAHAEDPTPTPTEGPHRKVKLTVSYTKYSWWLIRWQTNEITCRVNVEHEGLPSADEILTACGDGLQTEWKKTKPCEQAASGENLNQCSGMYLHPIGSKPAEREVEVELQPARAWLSISGCEFLPPQTRCANLPTLQIIGEEPLPNEAIIRVNGTLNGEPFSCEGAQCDLPLQPTGEQGVQVEFWADSSFGDSSEHYTAMVRVLPWGNFMSPEGQSSDPQLWYVDVLSNQWRGGALASCSDVWQVFPDVGGPPAWLSSPETVEGLESTHSYYYLAGVLITSGAVDASSCPNNGLQSPVVASACGVEAALSQVVEWQNLFDSEILQVSRDTGVPAQLMKNMFSRESQFWPGIYRNYREAGLGQLTENGADTVLLWNPSFYDQFCPLVLSKATCDLGFGNLKAEEQNILRGGLVNKVNSSCPNCPIGIDLSQANFSVNIFAQSLLANCEQVGRIVSNTTNSSPGQTTSYVDLWKFTLVNYNAGAGCLTRAIKSAYQSGEPLDWEHISTRLEPVCSLAIDYVNDISQVPGVTPTPTPWLPELPTLPPEATPEPQYTPQATEVYGAPTATPVPGQPTATPSSGAATSTPVPTLAYP